MIITKGTKMLVNSRNRGEFIGKARRDFSTDDAYYPITVVDPMASTCIPREETTLVARLTTIKLAETESENEIPKDEHYEIESTVEDEED